MASFVDDPHSASASQRAADESDLDPAAFLKSVRELSEKREREDAERYRKLEEEIEKGRQERAARRAERARSISPEKSNAVAPSPARTPANAKTNIASPPPITPPAPSRDATMNTNTSRPSPRSEDIPEFQGFRSNSKSKSNTPSASSPSQASEASDPTSRPTQSATSLARSGTLSWQQRRPGSRGGSRPTSTVAADERAQKSTDEEEKSRDQIAASLGARDPTWFRQTADRGLGNAAYRKSKDEAPSGDSVLSGRRGLLGLSKEPSIEPLRRGSPAPSESVKSDSTSRPSSVRDSGLSRETFSTTRTSTSSKPDLKSLIAEDEGQDKAAPMSERTTSSTDGDQSTLGRAPSMSSSQARMANRAERPTSPTKGMGGFVQSAMMKRSDSVNKRSSAQPGTSLNRQNSTASSVSGYGGLQGSHSMPRLEPTGGSRETSNEPLSRPSSSSSNLTHLTATQGKEDKDVFIKPSVPHHNRSKSVASNYSTAADEGRTSPPSSPSKRWSPTKSSWLESAITKPESPKPSSARNSQPSWMADIAKAKADRASANSTPKPPEDEGSRPGSPTKVMFGQSMLQRSDSRDLAPPRTLTPKPLGSGTPRSSSPVKSMQDQKSLSLSESENFATSPAPLNLTSKAKPADETPKADNQPGQKVRATAPERDVKDTPSAIAPQSVLKDEPSSGPAAQAEADPLVEQAKTPATSATAKAKPETPPKPQTDFRSNLRSRGASEAKQQDTPEFLSKFGNLRKTTTQNYVAPDVLKANITRGKSELAKTDGPVKSQRKDELKESLLAKKEQWKQDKEQGIVHERKTSGPPSTPQKPEALAKRELLGRADSTKAPTSPEKPKTATPEALARHKSLKGQPMTDASMPGLEKQTSAPARTPAETTPRQPVKQTSTPVSSTAGSVSKQQSETSKLAAKFNPGLASILARGPPAATNPSRSESADPVERSRTPAMSPLSETVADDGQLQDMRKGRAKGPKRRKGGAKEAEVETAPSTEPEQKRVTADSTAPDEVSISKHDGAEDIATPVQKAKPRAPPGSAASLMMASLQKSSVPTQKEAEPDKATTPSKASGMFGSRPLPVKPSTPAKSPAISGVRPVEDKISNSVDSPAHLPKPTATPSKPVDIPTPSQKSDVPEFKGFASAKKPMPVTRLEDDKENAGEGSPSVKSAISGWGRQSTPKKSEMPTQIQLPSKKDEEAAMRSAGLLASSPSRPSSQNGLGISVEKSNARVETPAPSGSLPPKPTKSSRAISGQLQEASPNQGPPSSAQQLNSEAVRLLVDVFGTVSRSSAPLSIDTPAVISSSPHQERVFRTVRKSVQVVSQEKTLRQLPPSEEFTFFDESVYLCEHAYTVANGPKKTEIFLWTGNASTEAAVDQAQNAAKKIAKEAGNAFVNAVRQGFEPPGFLQALGGILVTRNGTRETTPKQYMLCGRKHLGQITFDEVDFGAENLCHGFAYLISYPVTLQETRLYLWKGSACSTEEISAARLAAMDLSETGEIVEVDGGAEFASFLKVFGSGTTKASIPKPTEFWQQKALAPDNFATRLFRIQPAETKSGLFSGIFTRRPSWNNVSPSRRQDDEFKTEAKELSPLTQSDLEVDSIYLLDAYSELYVLIGPTFPSQTQAIRDTLFSQTLLFASEYGVLATSTEDRPTVPKALVLFSGVPDHVKLLFRHWDDGRGLWGTAGLMAGSQTTSGKEVKMVGLDEVLGVVR